MRGQADPGGEWHVAPSSRRASWLDRFASLRRTPTGGASDPPQATSKGISERRGEDLKGEMIDKV
jgi:hypothetical protein